MGNYWEQIPKHESHFRPKKKVKKVPEYVFFCQIEAKLFCVNAAITRKFPKMDTYFVKIPKNGFFSCQNNP